MLVLSLDKQLLVLAWSPDSTRLAGNAWVSLTDQATGRMANPLFTVWDARIGQHAVTCADSDSMGNGLARLAWSPDGRYPALQRVDFVVEVWHPR